jgi:3-oxoacyl-[acyl-carrier-protein] synthase II
MQHTIDICGIGVVSPYGWGRDRLWEGLADGVPAAHHTEGYGESPADAGWVGLVPEGGDPADGSLFARAMLAAAREALADADHRGWSPGRRVGLIHGSVLDDARTWTGYHHTGTESGTRRDFISMMTSTPMMLLMAEYGFHGPAMEVAAMCATGNLALITAKTWLDSGYADDVVVVTTDLSATRPIVRDFVNLGVAITDAPPLDACRPFQRGSRGFTFAEAAAAVVVSRHGSDSYARILGGAMGHEAYHAISLDPDPQHVIATVNDALSDAGVEAAAVRYLNAHGPGTRQGDASEAAMLAAVFPSTTQVYSFKPLAGHCQTATSLLETAATCLAAQHALIPAAKQVAPGHPQLLDGPTRFESGLTVKTSLGMGGFLSAVVLETP